MTRSLGVAAAIAILTTLSFVVLPSTTFAQKKKPATKTQKNETKGQGQLSGGLVKFGEVYSLKGGLNFEILKASYSMEPFASYAKETATADKKFVVLDIAIKNATPKNNDNFPGITIIDSAGQKYDLGSGMVALNSFGDKDFSLNLKPGQGYGQPSLNDPFRVAFLVPLEAKITKIMINQPRLNKNEEVLRYLVAGTDKEADAANIFVPLPKSIADPSDSSGAVAMGHGKVKVGDAFTSYFGSYRINKVSATSDAVRDGKYPDSGKQFVVVSITVKNIGKTAVSLFYMLDRDKTVVKDQDGEKSEIVDFLKASSNDAFSTDGKEIDPGEELSFRMVFQIGEKSKLSSLNFTTPNGYPWTIDLSI